MRQRVDDVLPAVLHIDTERGWRGGERQVLWLAEELAVAGHETALVARPGEPLAERARERAVRVIPCAPRMEFDLAAALAVRREIVRSGAGIVHAHTAHGVALAALATLHTPARVVVTRRVDFRLRRNLATRWKYRRAHAIIAISRAVATALVEGGIPRQRIAIIPDGIDLSRAIQPASRDTLQTLGVARGPLVVQVAQLVPHKDPLNFVRAIAATRRETPELQALLVGDGPLRTVVEAEVHRLGLDDALHVAGYRDDADALLAAADVVTLSSAEEGMGSVLLDALMLGKPVAATAAGGIPDVIRDGETGLLAPIRNPEALGQRVARLLQDAPLAARLAAAGRASVEGFSMARVAERTVAVYRQLLRGTAVRSSAAERSQRRSSSPAAAP